ncbi:MAG: hypothetical protein ABI744_04280 [Chloroflexota bacterium]
MAVPGGYRDASHVGLKEPANLSRRNAHGVVAVAALVAALLTTTGLAAPPNAAVASSVRLKAVIIVGPTHDLTAQNLDDGEQLAEAAEGYGMDVRRVLFPNATWANVLANVQGANLVIYLGHGYGWPSPYPPFREKFQNGVGLDPYAGASRSDVDYHGGKQIRDNWHLAPNAVVFLGHLCYAAGQSESGMGVPAWSIAQQRVDNMASAYLYAGAGAVFAFSLQSFQKTVQLLLTTDQTVDQIFRTPGTQSHSYYGWIGSDPRYFDSVRTPGARNLIDPDLSSAAVYERAVTGNLLMTGGQWRGDEAGAWSAPAFQSSPPTPQGLAVKAYAGRVVKLTWESVSVNYFGGATYNVFRNGKAIAKVGGATSFTDRPPKTGIYRYQVRALDPVRAKSPLSTLMSVQVLP